MFQTLAGDVVHAADVLLDQKRFALIGERELLRVLAELLRGHDVGRLASRSAGFGSGFVRFGLSARRR